MQCLKNQKSVFTHSLDINDSAVKASHLIAYEIAMSSKPFSENEFTKTCMLRAAEVVFPKKAAGFCLYRYKSCKKHYRRQDFRSPNKFKQPFKKQEKFIAFSVAIDESTDITDVAQLAIFIRAVEKTLIVSEEFVEMVPMSSTTTTADIFTSLVGVLNRVGVDWSHAISLAAHGAPAMIGRKVGVVTMFREKVQSARAGSDFWNFRFILHQEFLYCKSLKMDNVMKVVIETMNFIRSRSLNNRQFDSLLKEKDYIYGLPYHTEVRWLSRGAVMRYCRDSCRPNAWLRHARLMLCFINRALLLIIFIV